MAPDGSPNLRLGGRLSFVEHSLCAPGEGAEGTRCMAARQSKTRGVGAHAGPGGRGGARVRAPPPARPRP